MKTNQWIKPFLFTLLVVVAPIAAYYVYFVEASETFFLERFHAHLANTAARTENRFSSAFDVIEHNPEGENELGVEKCSPGTPAATHPGARSLRSVSRAAADEVKLHTEACSPTADVRTLVGDIDPEHQFYDIVIFDESNRVVFQRDAENGRIADGQLVEPTGTDGEPKATVQDPLVEMRRNYQGRPFLVFAQPLKVPVSDPEKGAWTIVGLLGQSEFTALKYGVRPGGIALVTLMVLGVLLAGPFLKLWYLGRFERLSRFDIFVQIGAGLSLVALATVAWLAWDTYARLSEYFDERLRSIATELREAVESEFGMAAAALEVVEDQMVDAYDDRIAAVGDATWGDEECPTLAGGEPQGPGRPTAAADLLKTLTNENSKFAYRQIELAHLMDQKGCQLVKWSSKATWPRPGQFGDRKYFKRALPDERTPLNLYGTGELRFFQDVVVSRTTGEHQIVFSKPVKDSDRCARAISDKSLDRVPCVSVVDATLRALESVLPYGFGAMLVDAQSTIILRNDGDTSTELNLAKEISQPERLRTVVELGIQKSDRAGEWFGADYRRKPHRFYVVPLGVGELVLVAFYNQNIVTATVLESVGAAGTAWLIWVSVLSAFLLAYLIADDMMERSFRRWPVYFGIGLPMLLVGTWFALVVSRSLPFAVAGFLLALMPLVSLMARRTHRVNAQLRRLLIVLPIWLAVMLAAAFPMKILYAQAERETLKALTRFESLEYDRGEALQAERFDEWKHEVGLRNSETWVKFDTWRNEKFYDPDTGRAPKEELDPNAAATRSGCRLIDIVCRILKNLPDYSADLSGIHAMYREGDPPSEARNAGEPNDRDPRAVLLGTAPETYVFHLVVAVAALLLSAVAVWYLTVRTFGLRAEDVENVRSAPMPSASENGRYIVYGVPARQRRRYLDRLSATGKLWIDLRDAQPGLEIDVSRSTDAIALDEFDSNLNDIGVVRERLELLERLLREGRRVILLFVNTDPLNFVMAQYDTEENAALLARFATALSRFRLTYHGPIRERAEPTRSGDSWLAHGMAAVRRLWVRSGREARRLTEGSERPGWRKKLVAAECRHPDLWEIRKDLRTQAEAHKWSKGQIVQQAQSRANAIYQHMWSKCTRVEKFTLIELAHGHPVNPNNWDAARRLRMRGYVIAAPFYRIASESLRRFVIRMERVEQVQLWRAENPGAWDQIKIPLMVLLVGAVIFVAVTQPALFNSLFAFLAAGVASFPFIVSALNARLQRTAKPAGK